MPHDVLAPANGADARARLVAAFWAENRARDQWQLRAYVVAFVGIVVGLVTVPLALPSLSVVLFATGLGGGFVCLYRVAAHMVRAGHYRRQIARCDAEQVRWYTGITDTPEQKAAAVAQWRRHPVVMSLSVAFMALLAVFSVLACLHGSL